MKVDCSRYPTTSKGIICTDVLKPICGADKKTYRNECSLCATNAEKGLDIKKLHDGQCTSRLIAPQKNKLPVLWNISPTVAQMTILMPTNAPSAMLLLLLAPVLACSFRKPTSLLLRPPTFLEKP
ncbi:ovomucoid-like isoform X2 [Monodelphis domestica]|uniref:ovomucoid-like isoform X2 n=1 Tax=Monodelphis domestica TaxID=13616 RepID=UPI0007B418CF|nr:ovomucoid-like isoform X2 [Monodelphis domestica]XP_056667596.1 ovomucoid-like isoform X2 [Monodelphis domestica]XP_056667597.1 ovomucoid-like isoform X2 [Monodelphis domestica]